MSHDPLAQIEQNVLDMIEQSPVGAVPHTPTYQDGLRRLIDSHQVYHSADHKDGYVTVRSLADLPLFHAQNLELLLSGKIPANDLETDSSIFARYVASLPANLRDQAETYRELAVAGPIQHRSKLGDEEVPDPVHTLFLVPGSGPNLGLPGNYLHGAVDENREANDHSDSTWTVQVHDSIIGGAIFNATSQDEAFEKLQEVLASAPFLLSELEILDFQRL